jgi:plastocyanin
VRFTGETIPTSTIIPVAADVEFCGHEHSKEDYVIEAESRGIRYVIVRLTSKELRKWPHAKPAYLVLDNKDCRFEPHGAVLTVGSTIELCNSDPISHTTHAYFGTSFNYALPAKGSSIKHVFKFPGMTLIRCDMHGWMNAFIRVDRHPFHAVTDAQGRFKIIGVPAGKYTLVAWHEQFGPQRKSISVRASQTITEELTYPVSDEVNSTK